MSTSHTCNVLPSIYHTVTQSIVQHKIACTSYKQNRNLKACKIKLYSCAFVPLRLYIIVIRAQCEVYEIYKPEGPGCGARAKRGRY